MKTSRWDGMGLALTIVFAIFVIGSISYTSWKTYQRGGSLWATAVLGITALAVALVAYRGLSWQQRHRQETEAMLRSAGSGREAMIRMREMSLSPAAPRVLKQGLPTKLELRRKKTGRRLIGGLLCFACVSVLLAGLNSGKLGVMLFGLAPLALFGLFQTRKFPKQLVADPMGLWIDDLYKPWTEVTGIREQFGRHGSTFLLHVVWSAKDLPKLSWSPLTAGGLRLDLGGYAGRRRYCEEAFACMAIWHYRAERSAKDAKMQAEVRAKFDRIDELFKTDPAAAERAMEQDIAEMESKMRALGITPPGKDSAKR